MVTALPSTQTSHSPITYLQTGLALLAATVLGFRTVRTANGQAVPDTETASHILGAALTASAGAGAVAAAVLLLASRRRPAAAALALTLGLELFVLDLLAAPPRLVTALPLSLALALFLATGPSRPDDNFPAGTDAPSGSAPQRPLRTAAIVVALLLMLPVGFQYLMSGLVVPAPDLFGMYALFAILLAGAAVLARRRSWWALAVPPIAAALWFLVISLGGHYLGWQP